jgi:uncharacterized protein involved in exopolysaccharide biosynthesis
MEHSTAQRNSGRETITLTKDISLLEIILFLWRRKWWIIAGTVIWTGLGVIYALNAPLVYYSEAIITPKTNPGRSGGSALLAQLGGLAGGAAAELGMGDNNLQIIQITVRSRDLAESVIKKHKLLGHLYPEQWDTTKTAWKTRSGGKPPTLNQGVEKLRDNFLITSVDPIKNTLSIGINAYDPVFACNLVNYYLEALSRSMISTIKEESEANQAFLNAQLRSTADPWLIEKIQVLIAAEIEKSMLINSRPFRVLEKPAVPMQRIKPKRTQIVLISFVSGILLSMVVVVLVAFLLDVKKRMKTTGK